MDTDVTEIAADIYRMSTFVEPSGLVFNQYLVLGDEPLLFHTGMRALFPLVTEAVARVMPVENLRWITFGHLEADECGAMNLWLERAPQARIAHGEVGCLVSVNDLADRPPVPLADGQIIDIGGRRLRRIETPHVPHGWDAGVLFEEATQTLLCGDLFTATGPGPATTDTDIVEPALAAETQFGATCLTPRTGPTLRALARRQPATLGLMHGPAYTGACGQALDDLADAYDELHAAEGTRLREAGIPDHRG
jgi:flavorubredoxin